MPRSSIQTPRQRLRRLFGLRSAEQCGQVAECLPLASERTVTPSSHRISSVDSIEAPQRLAPRPLLSQLFGLRLCPHDIEPAASG
jgi:hypothetical protein